MNCFMQFQQTPAALAANERSALPKKQQMHQQDYTALPDVITEKQAAGRKAEAELTILESQGGRVLAILLGPSLWRRQLLLCLRDVCLLLLLWRVPCCQVCDAFKVACN